MTEQETKTMLDACPPELMQKIIHDVDFKQKSFINKKLKQFGKKGVSELTAEEKQNIIDTFALEDKINYYKGELADLEYKLQKKEKQIFLFQTILIILGILSTIKAFGGFDCITWHIG